MERSTGTTGLGEWNFQRRPGPFAWRHLVGSEPARPAGVAREPARLGLENTSEV